MSKTAFRKFPLIALLSLFTYSCGPSLPYPPRLAEDLRAKGELDSARQVYLSHMTLRLADPQRASTENPYFYYLFIGDIFLEEGRIDKALEAYYLANEKNVERELIADRIRKVSSVLAGQGDLNAAIVLLRNNRYLDELLFDGDLDRLHKESIAAEDRLESEKQADYDKVSQVNNSNGH